MFRLQDLEDTEELPPLWESSSSSSSKTQALLPLGRIFNLLFSAEPRELERALLAQDPSRAQQGMVVRATLALFQHVKDTSLRGLSLDQTCVPILEHAVKSKEPSYRKKSAALLRRLLQSREVGMPVASSLRDIIGASLWDNRVKLGWCVLIRELVHSWSGQLGEDSPLHTEICEVFVSCVPHLVHIVRVASVKEDQKRVPTRLSIAAADCLLIITRTLATGPPAQPEVSQEQNLGMNQQKPSLIIPVDSSTDDGRLSIGHNDIDNIPSSSTSVLFSDAKRRESSLWRHLDNLLSLVRELEEVRIFSYGPFSVFEGELFPDFLASILTDAYVWNRRSRPLFTKGLQSIQARLQLLAKYRDSVQSQGGDEGDVSIGAAVLAACWQHYSGLILTEDKKISSHPQPVLQHWLDGLQFYMQQTADSETEEENRKALEMRGYALACISLVLGRLDARHLELTLGEFELDLLKAMFGQLREADNNIVDLAVAVLRAILFRPTPAAPRETGSPAMKMESVVPMLLEMLDKQDTAARAVVLLVAEYFAVNPESIEMQQLFARLDSEEPGQRRNALDVLTELLSICTRSVDMINSSLSQTIAKHLFKRLGDAELTNRVEASAIFAKLDPSLTLPTLLELLYSLDGRIRSAASAGVRSVLKGHTNPSRVIAQLLDAVTKMVTTSLPGPDGQTGLMINKGRKSDDLIDVDRVMRLIPEWAETVEDWEGVLHVVVSKMFEEPANAVIPRFLSYISNQLADQLQILFPLILNRMHNQPKITQASLSKPSEDDLKNRDGGSLSTELFQRLSPLLILRVLPLKAFNNPNCKDLYGRPSAVHAGAGHFDNGMVECIMSLLLDRVCGDFEFEDVRKVASELTGRLLPDIMIPLVTAQLEEGTYCHDVLRVKACIYVFCTSLGIRGWESLSYPLMGRVCQLLTSILLWPWSQDKGYSEVGKAQHGCIDCFAMMVCAELLTRTAVHMPDELPIEPSNQNSLVSIVEELPDPQVEVKPLATETTIKFVEELPESEQLKSNGFGMEGQNRIVAMVPDQEQVRESLTRRRRPTLIEELPDPEEGQYTGVRGDQRNAFLPEVLSPVIDCLTGHQQRLPWSIASQVSHLSEVDGEGFVVNAQSSVPPKGQEASAIVPLPFRLCMANVLISTCQKVAVGARNCLAARMIPPLITFVQVSGDSKIKGACLQVLFTAVYHLKASAVLLFATDLFYLSTEAIKSRGLLEERVGGAKLLASLLASEEILVRDLAPHLMDAQLALASISAIDSSPEFRVLCEKLLTCLSTPGDM